MAGLQVFRIIPLVQSNKHRKRALLPCGIPDKKCKRNHYKQQEGMPLFDMYDVGGQKAGSFVPQEKQQRNRMDQGRESGFETKRHLLSRDIEVGR